LTVRTGNPTCIGPCDARDGPGVLSQPGGPLTLCTARRCVLAEPSKLIEEESRPDRHRCLTREVRGTRRLDSLRPVRRLVGRQSLVQLDRVQTCLRVQGRVAAVVDELTVVAERESLEGLLRES